MKEKMKWFGRYLGCKAVDFSNNNQIFTVKMGCYGNWKDCKLMLKAIEDISDEDYFHILKTWNTDSEEVSMMDVIAIYQTPMTNIWDPLTIVEEIDYLRSKGYAIGIPKEYYITEKELKY